MKHLLFIIVLCNLGSTLLAQNFDLFLPNDDFLTCEENLDNLQRLRLTGLVKSNKYQKDGAPFSGCAKALLTTPDGTIKEYVVTEIKDGNPTRSMYYFPDGSVSREFNFKDGLPHGLHIMYYKNKGKYIEEHYEDGRKHGTIKRWTKEGKLARDGFFQGGMAVFDMVYVKDDNC